MAIWYKLDGENFGIKEFMDMFQVFHDYRINKVTYNPEKDCMDVFWNMIRDGSYLWIDEEGTEDIQEELKNMEALIFKGFLTFRKAAEDGT